MMYGEVIKQIRLNKNLPLKSVYFGICSKTNAVKFENGERMLAADKFAGVLANLMLTMPEFSWIKNGYHPQKADYYQYIVSQAWNAHQPMRLEKHLAQIEASQVERAQLASYRLLQQYDQKVAPDRTELAIIIGYFSNLATWSISDAKFFANNCYVLPYSLLLSLLQEALKVQKRYRYYPNSDQVFATILTNCSDRMVQAKDFSNLKSTLARLDKMTTDITMAGYYLLSRYYRAKVEFLYQDHAAGEVQLIKIRGIAAFLKNQALLIEIDELLKS